MKKKCWTDGRQHRRGLVGGMVGRVGGIGGWPQVNLCWRQCRSVIMMVNGRRTTRRRPGTRGDSTVPLTDRSVLPPALPPPFHSPPFLRPRIQLGAPSRWYSTFRIPTTGLFFRLAAWDCWGLCVCVQETPEEKTPANIIQANFPFGAVVGERGGKGTKFQ